MSSDLWIALIGLGGVVLTAWLSSRGVFGQTDTQRITLLWARVDKLEARDQLKSRIILALLGDLHRLVPDYQPAQALAADLAELEKNE